MGGVRERGYTRAEAHRAVGKGWGELVDAAYDAVEGAGARITQIKEKYGELVVYFEPYDALVGTALGKIERCSAHVCEDCGAPGTLTADRRWVLALCPACMEKLGRK